MHSPKRILAFILLLFVAWGGIASYADEVDILDFLPAFIHFNLQNAITAIGSNQVILQVPPVRHNIVADLSIPANVSLKVKRGAVLVVATGKTLTINGSLEAGLYRFISCTGTGKVQFGAESRVKEIFPQWWGAVGDGVNNDLTAVQAALYAPAGNCTVKFVNGTYFLDGGSTQYILNWPAAHGISLIGEGLGTKLICKSRHVSPIGIYLSQSGFTANGLTIANLAVQGPSDGVSVPHTLIRFYTTATNIMVSNVELSFSQQIGLSFAHSSEATTNVLVDNCYFHDICTSTFATPGSGVLVFGSNGGNLTIRNCSFDNINDYIGLTYTQHAIYLSKGSKISIERCYFNGERARCQSWNGYTTGPKDVTIIFNTFNGVNNNYIFNCNYINISNNVYVNSSILFGNGASNWKMSDNLFYGNFTGQYAIAVQGDATNGEFNNNRMTGTALSFYSGNNAKNISLQNNHIAATTGYAIALDSTGDDFQCISNYFESGNASSVRLYADSGRNYIFQGNTFHPGAGTYAIQNDSSNTATYIFENNIVSLGNFLPLSIYLTGPPAP